VLYAEVENIGPSFVPPGVLHFHFTIVPTEGTNAITSLRGMTLPRYYPFSRIDGQGTRFETHDTTGAGDVVRYDYTAAIGALGSDVATIGVVVHLDPEFG